VKTTIIIPTYNESENIPELVKRIRAAIGNNVDILFMDDSPGNETADAAKATGCQVIHRTKKKGLSRAVIEGIQKVEGDTIIVMDADLQHPPEVLPQMLKVLETNELVVPSRWVPGGGVADWSRKRVLVSKVANLLAWPLVPKIKDRTSGFFGFKKTIIEDPAKLNPTGWKIGLEIMAKGKYTKAAEIPFTFVPRNKGESKMSMKQMWEYVKQLIGLYFDKFPILNFMVVGGIGFIINMLIYSWLITILQSKPTTIFGKVYYIPPFIISSEIAIVSNYLLNKYWTFRKWKEKRASFLRYLAMGSIALVFDTLLLAAFVTFFKLYPTLAAALAIIIMFIVRYLISKNWIWSNKVNPKA
jgi:dolichol-phosphate mannosyltransferase